jgi:hypothetical protein
MFPTKLTHGLIATIVVLAPLYAEGGARRPAVSHPSPRFNQASTEGGYASRASVLQGGTLTFHIASTSRPFAVDIVNMTDPNAILKTVGNLTSHAQDCSGQFVTGCGWDATTTISIPFTWPSGYYAARFPTSFGIRWAPFIVRSATPGRSSKILVVSPTNTVQVYNRFGGSSLYFDDLGRPAGRVDRVSYQRPYSQDEGRGGYRDDEEFFADWMKSEGIDFEVASDVDLEDSTLLSHYNLVVIAGHAEYWTSTARANLEQFSRSGRHIAVLNGNTMWWQVRLEDNQQTLVGYKDFASDDPLKASQPALVTTNWFQYPVYNPETRILGTTFLYGGYANRVAGNPDDYSLLPMEQRTGWTVTEPGHWVYQGTGLTKGATFGRETVGLEVDGSLFNCDANGNIVGIDPSPGTPLNFHVLGVTPASGGYGTFGIYTNSSGGTVFNTASQRWVFGLRDDTVVRRITRNVINRLSSGVPEPYDQKQSVVLAEDTFNCQQYTLFALPGWTATLGKRGAATARCAYEGPAGMELNGTEGIELYRDFTPTEEIRNHVELRFYVNLDNYQRRSDFPLSLVTLRHTVQKKTDQPLLVEFDVVDGQRMVRVARRDAERNFFPTDWIPLASGWHLIEVSWSSPGQISLQVDSGPTQTLNNPNSGEVVGEVFVEYLQGTHPDNGYVCIDALAVGTAKLGSVPAIK